MKIGLIISTGFNLNKISETWIEELIETRDGVFPFKKSEQKGVTIYATTRNGFSRSCPPHEVNYKGIISACEKVGITHILSTSMVGSLKADIEPGTLLVLDQFLDFTKHRDFTAYEKGSFSFCDFTEPYCSDLRQRIISQCDQHGVSYQSTGCYVGVDGPRYETAAEVRMYNLLGGDVVGMTNLPEVIIAREKGICYANLSLVVNYGAGIVGKVIREDCYKETIKHVNVMEDLIADIVKSNIKPKSCECRQVPYDKIEI